MQNITIKWFSIIFSSEKSSVSGVVEEPCLLDHMEVELVDIDLFSAVSLSQQGDMFKYKRQVGIIHCLIPEKFAWPQWEPKSPVIYQLSCELVRVVDISEHLLFLSISICLEYRSIYMRPCIYIHGN